MKDIKEAGRIPARHRLRLLAAMALVAVSSK